MWAKAVDTLPAAPKLRRWRKVKKQKALRLSGQLRQLSTNRSPPLYTNFEKVPRVELSR